MTNRAKSIPELPLMTAAASDDLLIVVDSSAANTTKRSTVATVLAAGSNANLTLSDTAVLSVNNIVVRKFGTPANSNISVQQGTVFFDADFLYVAVADNVLKRVPLGTF